MYNARFVFIASQSETMRISSSEEGLIGFMGVAGVVWIHGVGNASWLLAAILVLEDKQAS